MGALVGGLYASGMSVDDMEQLVVSTDWARLFDDSLERPDRSYRRKQDDRVRLATVGVGIRRGRVRMSAGVLQGQRVLAMLERATLPASSIGYFDDLPIPYRAVATDLNTGRAVVLDHGSLSMAMRASMSLPGIFQPVDMDGKVLLDGGLANQVPVDVARAMGADIVIAVDVGTPLERLGSDVGVLDVLSQISTMMTTRNASDQLGTIGAGDVVIVPELGNSVSSAAFGKAAQALAIGAEAAEAASPRLAPLALSEQEYETLVRARVPNRDEKPMVDFVRLDNQTEYADELLLAYIDAKAGEPLDVDRMEFGILRAYSLGTLSSITYEVMEEDGRTGVLIRARPKPQGPNYLQLGLRLSSDMQGSHESAIRAAILIAPLSKYGAEGRVLVDVGSEPALIGEYFHPFDYRNRYLLYSRIGYENTNVHLFNDEGDNVATYDVRTVGGEVRVGREFGNHAAVAIGLEGATGRADVEVGLPALRRFDIDHGAWSVSGSVDRLDSLFFPRSGYFASLAYESSRAWLGSDTEYEKIDIDAVVAKDVGRHAFQFGTGYHSAISGQLPIQERYRLGGRAHLVGFRHNELTGQHYALLVAGYSYQLAEVFGRSALVGGTLEYGNAWERRSDMRFNDGIANAGVYIGFDSWLGPMLLGYGWREGGDGAVFLEIGKPF